MFINGMEAAQTTIRKSEMLLISLYNPYKVLCGPKQVHCQRTRKINVYKPTFSTIALKLGIV
jgi:hypothetical protein